MYDIIRFRISNVDVTDSGDDEPDDQTPVQRGTYILENIDIYNMKYNSSYPRSLDNQK